MNDPLRERWMRRWKAKFGEEETSRFQEFIKNCPEDIEDRLSREPLLLYLLARLHREGHISNEILARARGIQAKVIIYRECINWVLEKQRDRRFSKSIGLDTSHLRSLMQEVALCTIQSGTGIAKFAMLEARFKNDKNPIADLIQRLKDRIGQSEKNVLNNLFTTFYLKLTEGDTRGSVEFIHKSFGEFLFAERLKNSFESWVKKSAEQDNIEENRIYDIYDLLGYGSLNRDIIDYLIALLGEDEKFDIAVLFKQLYEFYLRWCEGLYLDRCTDDKPPRSKMVQLQEVKIQAGLRQVDIYTGLNVMILLFEIHRNARKQNKPPEDLNFNPCVTSSTEKPEKPELETMLRIIGYSYCLNGGISDGSITRRFIDAVSLSLSYVNLANANLHAVNFNGVDLSYTNLSNADLSRADLRGAVLRGAILQGAILRGADLRGAVLEEAQMQKTILSDANLNSLHLSNFDLSEADLSGLDLRSFDLSGTTLNGAILSGTNLSGLDLSGFDLRSVNLTNATLNGTNLSGTNLSDANLSGLDLSEFDLSNVDLRDATLTETELISANLSGANLSGLDLSEFDLSNVDLRDATLTETELISANLSGANLSGLDLSEFDLRDVNLCDARLINTNLSKVVLDGAKLVKANLRGANLVKASLGQTDLSEADLGNSNLSSAFLENANLTGADLENVQCEGTRWEGVIGLESAKNLPEECRVELITRPSV